MSDSIPYIEQQHYFLETGKNPEFDGNDYLFWELPYWECAYYKGTGLCGFGCVDEPVCVTGQPAEGWEEYRRINMVLDEEQIARIAHAANRELQKMQQDLGTNIPISPEWDDLDDHTRNSIVDGVLRVQEGLTPEQSHENWMRFKEQDGWAYGPEKDEQKKTHPNMIPYDQLPADQQVKDTLFSNIVNAFSDVET